MIDAEDNVTRFWISQYSNLKKISKFNAVFRSRIKRLNRAFIVALSLFLFVLSQAFLLMSEYLKNRLLYRVKSTSHFRDELWAFTQNLSMFREINSRKPYFSGLPYQALQSPRLFGDRSTELRLVEYGVLGYINYDTSVLDLGSAEGFLGLKISQLTGASVVCVDHDLDAISKGLKVATRLNLKNVTFVCRDIKEFKDDYQFDVVLAMAAYKTDDGGTNFDLEDYLNFLFPFVNSRGLCIFESHFDSENLKSKLIELAPKVGFEIIKLSQTDNKNRHFAIFRKVSGELSNLTRV